MLLNDSDNDLPEDCRKLDIRTFVLYAKAQLNREQERFIDNHCGRCDNCRANLAYVYEIVKGNERLSTDGQTLLLKYLNDPIYKNAIEKLKDSIREEILDEIRFSLVDIVKDNKAFSLTNAEDCLSVTDYNLTNNQNSLDKVTSQTSSQTSKPFNKIINKTPNIKVNYSYFVSAFLVVVFTSLSIFTYLAINNPNQQSNNTNNPSNNSSSLNPIFSTITQPRPNDQLSNNLYQQLDTAIDEYLTSKNTDDLNKAKAIAKDIEQKYDDKYGVDLIGYYQASPKSAIEKLSIAHKALEDSFEQTSGDNYQKRLEFGQKLEKDFFSLGDLLEAYKTKALISKLYVQMHNDEQAKSVTQEGLSFSINNKYKFLETNFLLWQAKRICDTDVISGERHFLRVIDLGTKLNLYKSVNSAGMSLATLYYQSNDDDKAFALIKKLLLNFSNYKNTQAITLLQIAGLTSFNLHYYDVAEFYLKEAIINSQDINSPAFLQRSYVFLGLIYCEQKKFSEADEFYSKAEDELSNIKDDKARLENLMVLTGYRAKAMLLKENYYEASKLYSKQISLINDLHMNNNNLYMSQSHEGLAIALTSLGQKEKGQEYIAIANRFQNLAQANKQTDNCLLSFIPNNCNKK